MQGYQLLTHYAKGKFLNRFIYENFENRNDLLKHNYFQNDSYNES